MEATYTGHSSQTRRLSASELKQLRKSGKPVPICSYCHQVRLGGGDPLRQESWVKLNIDLHKERAISLTHGLCPACLKKILTGMRH